MIYEIKLSKKAEKYLLKLQENQESKIIEKVKELKIEPTINKNVKKLEGNPFWRLRVGDFRVIFDILDNKVVVLILKIGSRGDVYK
ncbi:MAG: type II toxin-antitoxin system RelE/ParE family toxin [Campylobacterales bacterium]|nr:type II toxin-antitoxin system RelE/ParE family toxin [Campylobacterales bacterium]